VNIELRFRRAEPKDFLALATNESSTYVILQVRHPEVLLDARASQRDPDVYEVMSEWTDIELGE